MQNLNKSLGDICEDIVIKLAEKYYDDVKKSEDYYDDKKDFSTICRKTKKVLNHEVKTQIPHIIEDCFTLDINQMKKCRNVDFVWFVDTQRMRIIKMLPNFIIKSN